jgi:hypothetical protein
MPHLARFARTRGEEFVRAAAHPADGVTVLVTLQGVPGLDAVGGVLSGRVGLGALRQAVAASVSRAAPTATVSVAPGRNRP